MSLTKEQLISLGFVPGKKKTGFAKTYDTLIYPLTKTDYLYINKNASFVWMCFVNLEGERINYQVINIGITGFFEMQSYLLRTKENWKNKTLFMTPHGRTDQKDPEPIS